MGFCWGDMEKTIKKSSFKETVTITTINLEDVGLNFNARRVGPKNFVDLRNANYGEGFRMPTIPEVVPLIYASLENQNYTTAQNVVRTLKDHRISGNTGILYTEKGMYAQDNPNLRNSIVSMNERILKSKLGPTEEAGVVFSDDKSVRFTPYGFKIERLGKDLGKNKGIIAIVGGQENAEKLVRVSEHDRFGLYFRASDYHNFLVHMGYSTTRIVILDSNPLSNMLDVNTKDCANGVNCPKNLYSFGVKKI